MQTKNKMTFKARWSKFNGKAKFFALSAVATFATLNYVMAAGASGLTTGITAANTQVGSIFNVLSTLILTIGAVVGLAGAIRVYNKWQAGDPDLNKHLIGWTAATVFLLLAGGVLKSFYGIA